jgi:hypothetical protein
MSKLTVNVSATIVLIFTAHVRSPFAQANPLPTMPENTATKEEFENRAIDENMNLIERTPITGLPTYSPPRYYPYRQQLTFRAGGGTDFPKIDFDDLVLGFQYLFPKFLSPKLEAGADLHKDGRGHLHVGLRWIYLERSYFRPSYKLALDHFADSKKKLATLAQIDNYYLRLGGTLEYVVWNPFSLRLECELVINFRYSELVPTLGLSRGW